MMNTKLISTGLFFIFIFTSGYWLSRLGKPYQTWIFTLHKLIGLAAGVFLILTVSRIHKVSPLTGIEMAFLAITILIFIGLVAAGGLLSIEAEGGLSNASPSVLSVFGMVHKVFPYLAVAMTGITLYLLLNRAS